MGLGDHRHYWEKKCKICDSVVVSFPIYNMLTFLPKKGRWNHHRGHLLGPYNVLRDLGMNMDQILHTKFRSSHLSSQTFLRTNNYTVVVRNSIFDT